MNKTIKKNPDQEVLSAPNEQIIAQPRESFNFNAENLIAKAIDQGTPVDTMEKLLGMRRDLKAEWAKEQYDAAMARFQSECPTIEKGKKVSFGSTSYSYAPLEVIVEQVKGLLSANGFSYTFDTEEDDKGLTIFCFAKHISGHMEKSKCFIAIDTSSKMNVSQKSGSAMTYGKRYAFCNAFGILTGDEDNDARTPIPPVSALPARSVPLRRETDVTVRQFFETKIGLCKDLADLELIGKSIADAKPEDLSASDKAMLRGKFKARKDMLTPEVTDEDIREAGL